MSPEPKITFAKNDGKPALVQKLRFPEFRKAPSWAPKRLGLALKFQPGFPFSSSGFNDTGKGLRLARNRDLRSDDIIVFYSEAFDPNFVVNDGDVLVGMDGDFTPTVWNKGKALLNQRVGRVLPRDDNDLRFLLYLLTLCLKGIEDVTARTTVKHLSHSAVEGRHEPLPMLAEQQKIAECLSSVDELIAAQARKVDALKTHKKGLMQQLFPREGETQPRLRFPEFQNDRDWEEWRLEQLVNLESGGTPSKANPAFWNGSVPWVSAKDMKQLFLDNAEDHISITAVDDGAKLVPSGTLLMLVRGMTLLKDVPICMVRREMSFNQDVKALRPLDGVDGLFLAWLLTSSKCRLLEMVTVAGHGTGKLDTDELKAMTLALPRPTEQHRIASCLSSLDALITAETKKLEALKRHKRGLMQQLFPSPQDVMT